MEGGQAALVCVGGVLIGENVACLRVVTRGDPKGEIIEFSTNMECAGGLPTRLAVEFIGDEGSVKETFSVEATESVANLYKEVSPCGRYVSRVGECIAKVC